jgi:hypothetical protein
MDKNNRAGSDLVSSSDPEIFFCCSCVRKKSQALVKHPRVGSDPWKNDLCGDCGHKVCEYGCVTQKASDPVGAWLVGIAAKGITYHVPWNPLRPWRYSDFQGLSFGYFPPFLCCHCKAAGHPKYNVPRSVPDPTKRTDTWDGKIPQCGRKLGSKQCKHLPCGECRISEWSEPPAHPQNQPSQTQDGPSSAPQRFPSPTSPSSPRFRVKPSPPPEDTAWECNNCSNGERPLYAWARCPTCDHDGLNCGNHCKKWVYEHL